MVFEDGIFEDTAFQDDPDEQNPNFDKPKRKSKKKVADIVSENLVPDRWREVQAEMNITKKERRKIAQEIEFNSRVEKRRQGMVPLRELNLEEYKAYKEAKLAQLKPLVLDDPVSFAVKKEVDDGGSDVPGGERVKAKNPRWAVYGRGLEDVSEFFSSDRYDPSEKKNEGQGIHVSFNLFFKLCFCLIQYKFVHFFS